jgi:hypothetical protein
MFCGDRENSRTSGPGYVSASHPLPFASCRFSFQIVPFLTGAVVFFFRRDESHMARDKKKRSGIDLSATSKIPLVAVVIFFLRVVVVFHG